MVSSVSTTYDYTSAMDAIRQEIEAYCEVNGIDSAQYLDSLDENFSLAVYDNPTLEAYFQLAYMQLAELLDPALINSLEAQIGEVNFETLYANAGDDFNELVVSLIEDDPELMAYYAMQGGGETEGQFLLDYLSEIQTEAGADSGSESFTDDARELAEMYGFGEGFEWVVDQEDLFKAAEMSILERLQEYDSAIMDLAEMLESGEISETYFESEMQNIYYGRETLLMMLSQVTEQEMRFFEMISEMYEKANEMNMSIINNMRGA